MLLFRAQKFFGGFLSWRSQLIHIWNDPLFQLSQFFFLLVQFLVDAVSSTDYLLEISNLHHIAPDYVPWPSFTPAILVLIHLSIQVHTKSGWCECNSALDKHNLQFLIPVVLICFLFIDWFHFKGHCTFMDIWSKITTDVNTPYCSQNANDDEYLSFSVSFNIYDIWHKTSS